MRVWSGVVGWTAAGLLAQEPAENARATATVRDGAAEATVRCAALAALQDRGALTPGLLVWAMAQEGQALQQTAVAIARHEWLSWPEEFRQALAAAPFAGRALLQELATAPRPVADAWVAGIAADAGRPAAERLLALAARAAPPDREEAQFVIAALADGGTDAAQAMARVPVELADRLVGFVHGRLLAGAPVERLWPFLDRLSPTGCQQLLGLAAALGDEGAAALHQQLAQRGDAGYRERLRAAVDGEIPLEEAWLLRAGPLLTTEARQRRVLDVLRDPARTERTRLWAFDALLEAKVFDPALASFAAGESDRWRRLVAAPVPLPDEVLLASLERPALLEGVLPGLARRSLPPAVQRRLVALLDRAELGPDADATAEKLCATLAQAGDDEAVRAVFAAVRGHPALAVQVYDEVARRRDPIAAAALLAELQRTAPDGPAAQQELHDHLGLVLAELGDRRQLERLVALAPSRRTNFVRRCRHAVPDLQPHLARTLLDGLQGVADHDVRIELLLWLGASAEPAVRAELQRRWREGGNEEERDAALRGLMLGPERAAILAEWRAAGPGGPLHEAVAFAAVGSMPDRLGDEDVELLRHLLFTAPRHDPRERLRARRFPDGRTGFPLVAAIADRMRRDPEGALRVCEPAERLAAAGDVEGLVRQRYLFLWTALQARPELLARAAQATAALVLAIPDAAGAGTGAASLYLGQARARRGDHAGAAAALLVAARHLLRLPEERAQARIHLGIRDAAAGHDPHAALAAGVHLCRAEAALAQGELAEARRCAAAARELAGRDRQAHGAVTAILERIPR